MGYYIIIIGSVCFIVKENWDFFKVWSFYEVMEIILLVVSFVKVNDK